MLGCSNLQRLYPAIAIEVQDAIGARGYGFDISLGCSAATGATHLASQAIRPAPRACALVVVPELTTGHMNWRERDSHFIFGDASVAFVIESVETRAPGRVGDPVDADAVEVVATTSATTRGYLDRCDPIDAAQRSTSCSTSKGRRVFKDVVPLAAKFIKEHLAAHELDPGSDRRATGCTRPTRS